MSTTSVLFFFSLLNSEIRTSDENCDTYFYNWINCCREMNDQKYSNVILFISSVFVSGFIWFTIESKKRKTPACYCYLQLTRCHTVSSGRQRQQKKKMKKNLHLFHYVIQMLLYKIQIINLIAHFSVDDAEFFFLEYICHANKSHWPIWNNQNSFSLWVFV